MPDAAAAPDEACARVAFAATYYRLQRRLSAMVALPFAGLAVAEAKAALDQIGRT